jgi:hypothetical protein
MPAGSRWGGNPAREMTEDWVHPQLLAADGRDDDAAAALPPAAPEVPEPSGYGRHRAGRPEPALVTRTTSLHGGAR